ncbi:MAG: hypothetical protein JRE65_04135, partial [Deltaproteobacteria bacterium]|nr:hypothetical protein [Deltaproteobacteria bacterium]
MEGRIHNNNGIRRRLWKVKTFLLFLMIFFGAFTQAFSKVAYIFIAPNLTRFTKDLNANRCILEKMDLEFMGYEVRIDFNGTEKRILQAILDPDVKAITYFGHGGSGSGSFWTPAKEPTLGAWNASSWMMTMEDALREKYIA